MTVTMDIPDVAGLRHVLDTLRAWQDDAAPMQLHPGDLGWFWRFGEEATAAAVRTWSRDGEVVAVGLLDGRALLRLTTAPAARRDEEVAGQILQDVADPARGVLPEGDAVVDAPCDALLQDLLRGQGWVPDEPWTPLRRDLAAAVEVPDSSIEVVGTARSADRTAVQRAAFEGSTFTQERWATMASGPAYAQARCLVAYDGSDPVAAVTVWSAGPGRPGLVEPMGVHRDHRGRGHGTTITLAGAAALRELGSSSVVVTTPTSSTGAVRTYAAAGMELLPSTRDLRRVGGPR